MGYTTKFTGALEFDREVEPWLVEYVNRFSGIRHMILHVNRVRECFYNWRDLCFKGQMGKHGQYFLGIDDYDFRRPSICVSDANRPPNGCPGLYCHWIIKDNKLVWDDRTEKFYEYVPWLRYLISNFFEPEGYVLNGKFRWQGEKIEDAGYITVTDNNVSVEMI